MSISKLEWGQRLIFSSQFLTLGFIGISQGYFMDGLLGLFYTLFGFLCILTSFWITYKVGREEVTE